MAVRVLARKNILVFGQRIEVFLLDEANCQIAVSGVSAALVGQEKIFRKCVGFVPGIGNVL